MKEIKITVHKDGKIEIAGKGFAGDACSVIRELGERLGSVEKEEFTEEYYQGDSQGDQAFQTGW